MMEKDLRKMEERDVQNIFLLIDEEHRIRDDGKTSHAFLVCSNAGKCGNLLPISYEPEKRGNFALC